MYLTYNVKEYFDSIVDFDKKSVLDFGCNHANFLLGTNNFASYTGIDIDSDVINAAKQKFPQHNWKLYKNYNWQYKADIDIETEWPEFDTYDIGVAFSVFTHTDFVEFNDSIKKLKQHCNLFLATFLSTDSKDNIKQVLTHRPEYFSNYIDELVEVIYGQNIISILVSKHSKQVHLLQGMIEIPKASNTEYILTFYNDTWLQQQLGGEVIDVTQKFNGILGTQKCLKLSTVH